MHRFLGCVIEVVRWFLSGNLIEDQWYKGKEGSLFTSKGNCEGLFLNFSKVQGNPSFIHRKDEFTLKQFKRLHGSLSFEDLETLQF